MKEIQKKRSEEHASKQEPEKPTEVEKEIKRGRWEEESDSEEERKRKKAKISSLVP